MRQTILATLLAASAFAQETPTPAPTATPVATRRPVVSPTPSAHHRPRSLADYARSTQLQRTPGSTVVITDQSEGIGRIGDYKVVGQDADMAVAEAAFKLQTTEGRDLFVRLAREAIDNLEHRRPPSGMPTETFDQIRARCKQQWGQKFIGWDNCEKDSIEAWYKGTLPEPTPGPPS